MNANNHYWKFGCALTLRNLPLHINDRRMRLIGLTLVGRILHLYSGKFLKVKIQHRKCQE